MTEQQILKKIESFNENDKIRAIVDFIENLPIEQRTTPVLGELGRAYNIIYIGLILRRKIKIICEKQ